MWCSTLTLRDSSDPPEKLPASCGAVAECTHGGCLTSLRSTRLGLWRMIQVNEGSTHP